MVSVMETVSQNRGNKIILFNIMTAMFWFAMYTYVPIFSSYLDGLGLSATIIGVVSGSYGFMQMVLRIPLGVMSDKLCSRKLFITWGAFFTIVSGVLFIVSNNVWLILIARGCAGIAASAWVNFTVLYSSYYKSHEAPKAVGILNFSNSIGIMAAMLIGPWASDNLGSDFPFYICTAIGIVAFIMSFFVVENTNKDEVIRHQQMSVSQLFREKLSVMKDSTLWAVSLIAIISQLITFATLFTFTPIYAKQLGSSDFQLGLLSVISYIPTAFGGLITGKYLIKFVKERVLVVWGMLLMGICIIIIPFTANYTSLVAVQTFCNIGKGLSFSLLMGLSIKHMPEAKRGSAMGFFQAVYAIGMFLGPIFAGAIKDVSTLAVSFFVVGSLGIVTAFGAHFILKKVM